MENAWSAIIKEKENCFFLLPRGGCGGGGGVGQGRVGREVVVTFKVVSSQKNGFYFLGITWVLLSFLTHSLSFFTFLFIDIFLLLLSLYHYSYFYC